MKKMALLLLVFVSLLSGCNSTEKKEIIHSPVRIVYIDVGIGARVDDYRCDNYFQVDRVVFENNYLCLEGDFKLGLIKKYAQIEFHPFDIAVRKQSSSSGKENLSLELDLEVTGKENECFIATENEYTLEGKSKLYYKIDEERLKSLGNCEFIMDFGITYMSYSRTFFVFPFEEISFK